MLYVCCSFYMSENQEAHMKNNKFIPRVRAPVFADDVTTTDAVNGHDDTGTRLGSGRYDGDARC